MRIAVLFNSLIFLFCSCHRPSVRSIASESVVDTVFDQPDAPASSPQTMKLSGFFYNESIQMKDSTEIIPKFIVNKVISLSSGLTHSVGSGDTLNIQLSVEQKNVLEGYFKEQVLTFQVILQERLVLGKEEVAYSVKYLQPLRESK